MQERIRPSVISSAWAPALTRAQQGSRASAESFSHQLQLLPSIADLVPTQVGHYCVPFLNYLGSRDFAGEDSILTEEVLESDCLV